MKEKTDNRINLGGISDDYVLGVVCAKTGLADYARRNMAGLTTDPDRNRLFELGMADADECSAEDVASELARARKKNPGLFDAMVRDLAGREQLAEIHSAIRSHVPKKQVSDSAIYRALKCGGLAAAMEAAQ